MKSQPSRESNLTTPHDETMWRTGPLIGSPFTADGPSAEVSVLYLGPPIEPPKPPPPSKAGTGRTKRRAIPFGFVSTLIGDVAQLIVIVPSRNDNIGRTF